MALLRSVRVWQRAKTRELGARHALTGAIAFTQRFSAKITVHPHVHAIVPDGVFAKDEPGRLVFHKLKPKQEDIERIARKAAKLFASLEDVLVPDALDHTRARATQEELALRIPLESVACTEIQLITGTPSGAAPLGRVTGSPRGPLGVSGYASRAPSAPGRRSPSRSPGVLTALPSCLRRVKTPFKASPATVSRFLPCRSEPPMPT